MPSFVWLVAIALRRLQLEIAEAGIGRLFDVCTTGTSKTGITTGKVKKLALFIMCYLLPLKVIEVDVLHTYSRRHSDSVGMQRSYNLTSIIWS